MNTNEKSAARNFKLKLSIPIIIAGILITGIYGIVSAQKKFMDGPHGFIIDQLLKDLNLSESQKTQVEKIKEQIHERMEMKKQDTENSMDEFADEFRKDNIDKDKLIELGNKRSRDEKEMKEFMLNKLIEFHDLLTPEQRSKAADNLKRMKEKFHDRGVKPGDRMERPPLDRD